MPAEQQTILPYFLRFFLRFCYIYASLFMYANLKIFPKNLLNLRLLLKIHIYFLFIKHKFICTLRLSSLAVNKFCVEKSKRLRFVAANTLILHILQHFVAFSPTHVFYKNAKRINFLRNMQAKYTNAKESHRFAAFHSIFSYETNAKCLRIYQQRIYFAKFFK